MVPMPPTPGGQTEQCRVRHGPSSPPVQAELPTPEAPSLKLKLAILPLRNLNSDLGQGQDSKTP